MNSKILTLLLAISAVAVSQMSHAALADQGGGHRHGGGMMSGNRLEKMGIQLTASQKAQIEQIQSNVKNKIEAVLTPEQRQIKQNMQSRRTANTLTAEQKQKMRQVRQETRQQLQAILTPEQQQQLRQKRQNYQRAGQPGRGDRMKRQGRMDMVTRLTAQGIQLTPEQKSKLEQLQSQQKEKMANILTTEQQQAFQDMKAQRQSLNLTTEQQQQIRAIRNTARQEMKAVLTPAQQQQLQQKRGRHHGRSVSAS